MTLKKDEVIEGNKEENSEKLKKDSESEKSKDEIKQEDKQIEEIKAIEVAVIGDISIHNEILGAQYNSSTGEYDFTNNFKYIKEYIESADLAIANLETTFSGEENNGFAGFPSFNTPDSLADAMKNTGFDVIVNMNNHALDRGTSGYLRTISVLKNKGFDIAGTREDSDAKRYIIKDIEGIKIGIIAYGYAMTSSQEEAYGLNDIPIPSELSPLMNYFHEYNLDEDLEQMKEQIKLMRNDGAEVIIFYMHWGEEYNQEPNDVQKKIAQYLTNEKADIILGTHPGCIQPVDVLKSSDGSSETYVVYSLGNFFAVDGAEERENEYAEDGVIVSLSISKNLKTKEVIINPPQYIPIWVNYYKKDNREHYEIVPATMDNEEYLSQEGKTNTFKVLKRTQSIMEKYSDRVKIKN